MIVSAFKTTSHTHRPQFWGFLAQKRQIIHVSLHSALLSSNKYSDQCLSGLFKLINKKTTSSFRNHLYFHTVLSTNNDPDTRERTSLCMTNDAPALSATVGFSLPFTVYHQLPA